MKLIFLPALFCFLSSIVLAQQSANTGFKIKGKLIDSASRKPIEYATISIFPADSKKPVNGAVSDNKGNFTVDNIAAGTYKLVAEFIGYKADTLYNISVNKEHPVDDVNDIVLNSESDHSAKHYHFRASQKSLKIK